MNQNQFRDNFVSVYACACDFVCVFVDFVVLISVIDMFSNAAAKGSN